MFSNKKFLNVYKQTKLKLNSYKQPLSIHFLTTPIAVLSNYQALPIFLHANIFYNLLHLSCYYITEKIKCDGIRFLNIWHKVHWHYMSCAFKLFISLFLQIYIIIQYIIVCKSLPLPHPSPSAYVFSERKGTLAVKTICNPFSPYISKLPKKGIFTKKLERRLNNRSLSCLWIPGFLANFLI